MQYYVSVIEDYTNNRRFSGYKGKHFDIATSSCKARCETLVEMGYECGYEIAIKNGNSVMGFSTQLFKPNKRSKHIMDLYGGDDYNDLW